MSSLVRAEPKPVPALKQWTPEQIAMAARSFAADCSEPELEVFVEVAARKGLDPWLGQIVAIKRKGKMVIQETVEGYRAVAERSGLYGGYLGPWWRLKDGPWDEVWLEDDYPAAAKILVIRKDWTEPAAGVAAWKSNAQYFKDKASGKVELVDIWQNRPDEMLAKCAEVRALKRAFSKELAAAGIRFRDLSDAQVVTAEARRAGLDDDARHELVAEVTGGRTESSTEMTDDETVEFRREVARRAAQEEEPSDAEVVEGDLEPGGVRVVAQAGPNGDELLYLDDATGERLTSEEGKQRITMALRARVVRDAGTLSGDAKREFDQLRRDQGIDPATTKPSEYSMDQLYVLDEWMNNNVGEPY